MKLQGKSLVECFVTLICLIIAILDRNLISNIVTVILNVVDEFLLKKVVLTKQQSFYIWHVLSARDVLAEIMTMSRLYAAD